MSANPRNSGPQETRPDGRPRPVQAPPRVERDVAPPVPVPTLPDSPSVRPSDSPRASLASESHAAPSPRLAIIGAISALLLLGMLFGASLWVLAAIVVGLLIGVNALLTNTWASSAVAVRAGGDVEVKVGARIPVEVAVTNRSRIPLLWLLVEDLLPAHSARGDSASIRINGARVAVMLLWGEETKRIKYEVECRRRGYFQLGPTVLETGDVMGLYRRYRVGNPPQFVTVLPQVVPLGGYEIGSRRPLGEIQMRENVMQDPTRLRGIRRWQPGDPMRGVHWSATARTGTLHSKVYERSSIIGVTLVIDLHEQTTPLRNEPARSDLAVTAAASIAHLLHESGEPVGLATNGRDAADRIRREGWSGDHRVRADAAEAASMRTESDRLQPVVLPARRGPLHFQETLRTLARLERTDGLTLPQLFAECESQLSSETTLLVLLQQCSAETLAALDGFSRRGRAVAVIVNNYEILDFSAIAGPLIAARIPVFHLAGPESIAEVCRQTLLR